MGREGMNGRVEAGLGRLDLAHDETRMTPVKRGSTGERAGCSNAREQGKGETTIRRPKRKNETHSCP